MVLTHLDVAFRFYNTVKTIFKQLFSNNYFQTTIFKNLFSKNYFQKPIFKKLFSKKLFSKTKFNQTIFFSLPTQFYLKTCVMVMNSHSFINYSFIINGIYRTKSAKIQFIGCDFYMKKSLKREN